MNQIKKFLCCLMVLCMLVSVLPITTYAADTTENGTSSSETVTDSTGDQEDDVPASTGASEPEEPTEEEEDVPPTTEAPKPDVIVNGTCGQEATWSLNETKGVLTISGTGIVYNYSAEDPAPWNKYAAKITSIVVADGITKLGNHVFAGFTKLTQVDLPESLTKIGSHAFAGCTALTKIALPAALEGIAIHMFDGCTKLKTVTIPAGALSIGAGAFINCTGLTEISIPKNVTSIGATAFSGCSGLTTVNLSAKISAIAENTFYDCTALTAISIPDGVKTIGDHAFYNCGKLASATLPKTLTAIGDSAFYNCVSLTGMIFPQSLTTIGDTAFALCGKLTALSFAEKLTTIGKAAFSGCSGVKQITFTGNAPTIPADAFTKITATAYYPLDNASWNKDTLVNYGGTITWKGRCSGEHNLKVEGKKESTCFEAGYTGDTICTVCGYVYKKGEAIAPLGHEFDALKPIHNTGTKTHVYTCAVCEGQKTEDCTYGEGKILQEATMSQAGIMQYTCTACGGTYTKEYSLESTIQRISGKTRYETAFAIADAMKENLGVSKFDAVIVASGTNFADALSGSYLAAVKNAPILISSGSNHADIREYIKDNVKSGSTVYLLGGTAALPKALEDGLKDYTVKRLSGKTRYETNLAILQEAGVGNKDILVCTGTNFADSLSASAANRPILLVSGSLSDAQKAFLDTLSGNKIYIIGGTAAVNEATEKALKAYGTVERLSGKNRYETSALVAHRLVKAPGAVVLAYGQNFPDGLCGGPLAVSMGAPLVLTENGQEAAAKQYVQGYKVTNGVVLGGASLISDAAVAKIFE